VLGQPNLGVRVVVSGVVVDHDVQLHLWVNACQLLEEGQELGVGVPFVAGVSGDLPGGDLQADEQAGRSLPPMT